MAGSCEISCKQRAKVAQGVAAHQLVLAEHEAGVVDLGVAGGEVIVPEERQLLAERMRTVEHPVQPPRPGLLAVGRTRDVRGHFGALRLEILSRRPTLEQKVNRFLRTRLEPALQLGPGCAEGSAAIEMTDLLDVPRRERAWPIRLPGPAWIDGVYHGGDPSRFAAARRTARFCEPPPNLALLVRQFQPNIIMEFLSAIIYFNLQHPKPAHPVREGQHLFFGPFRGDGLFQDGLGEEAVFERLQQGGSPGRVNLRPLRWGASFHVGICSFLIE